MSSISTQALSINVPWGSWGRITFVGKVRPQQGSFQKNIRYKYAQAANLAGIPTLQPVGRELKTISFTLALRDIVLLQPQISGSAKALGLMGLPIANFLPVEPYYGIYADIPFTVNQLNIYADYQIPYAFFEGENNLGYYVLESISENVEHYVNGVPIRDSIQLNFLEWSGEIPYETEEELELLEV